MIDEEPEGTSVRTTTLPGCGFMWFWVVLCGFMWFDVVLCGFMLFWVFLCGFMFILVWLVNIGTPSIWKLNSTSFPSISEGEWFVFSTAQRIVETY